MPDGTFAVSYSKRHSMTGTPITLKRKGIATNAEAKRVYNELIEAVHKKIFDKQHPTWERCLRDYIDCCYTKGYSEQTIYSDNTCLRKHTSKWGRRNIDSISKHEITELIQVNLAENTVGHKRYVLKCIRGVFNHAIEKRLLSHNPCPNVKELKLKAPFKQMPVLTEVQVKHFLNSAKQLQHPWYPIWLTAIFTGMRTGELFALRWDQVNLESRQIVVTASWNNKEGFKSTKSGDDRIIEIAIPLLTVFKELKIATQDEFVLPRIYAWKKGEQARILRHFLIGIGLPPVRFHDLRATWATMLLSKGVVPAVVMAMGGWKDMETMMIYMRKAGLDIKGATECLNSVHNPSAVLANNVVNLFDCQ